MLRTVLCLFVLAVSSTAYSQTAPEGWSSENPPRPFGRSPAAEGGSTEPDGYTPIPQWAGQTRAPVARKHVDYAVETVVSGITQGFAFAFLPDGSILLTEKPGSMRTVSKDGRLSEPINGLPEMWTRGNQGLLDVDL